MSTLHREEPTENGIVSMPDSESQKEGDGGNTVDIQDVSTPKLQMITPLTPPATPLQQTNVCPRCRQIGFYDHIYSLHWVRQTKTMLGVMRPNTINRQPWLDVGCLAELLENGEDCSTCWLLAKTVQNSDRNSRKAWKPSDRVYVLLRYSSHTTLNGSYRLSSAPVAITSKLKSEKITVVFARFMVSRQMTPFPRAFDLDGIIAPTRPTWQNDLGPLDNFYGRKTEDIINIDLVKEWISSCDANHFPCYKLRNSMSKQDFSSLTRSHSLKVIDVQQKRITSIPVTQEYVTLSYVWGKDTKQVVLSKKNEALLSQELGLYRVWDQISRTIKDAMMIVRNLGRRYLWVDSLCIMQDDPDTKHHWILNMGQVYKMSSLTIVAADGIDANAGLWGTKEASNRSEQLSAKNEANEFVTLEHSQSRRDKFNNSFYSTRAWTFQEYLLSPRLLVFFEGRVHFQCRATCFHEDMILDWTCPSIDDADRLYGTFSGYSSTTEELEFDYRGYRKIIAQYTRRNLTYQEDILRAFAGVSTIISPTLRSSMQCGIPVQYFDSLLLWRPEASLNRRVGFPSWSWAGWIGAVSYWPESHHYASPLTWAIWSGYIKWDLINTRNNRNVPTMSRERLSSMINGYIKNSHILNVCRSGQGIIAPVDAPIDTNVLTFWCMIAKFRLGADTLDEKRKNKLNTDLPYSRHSFPKLADSLTRRDILDYNNRFCGTLLLHEPYIKLSQIGEAESVSLVILSEADQRNRKNQFPFLNVMAISWVEEPSRNMAAAQRIGTGMILKSSLDRTEELLGWTRLTLL